MLVSALTLPRQTAGQEQGSSCQGTTIESSWIRSETNTSITQVPPGESCRPFEPRQCSDVDAMETSVLGNLSDLLSEMLTFVVVAGIVIWLQPVIGLCVMLPLMLSYFVVRRFSSRVKRIYEAVRARLGDIGSFVHDRLAGVQLTQSFAQRAREEHAFEAVTQAHYEQSVKALRARNAFFPAVGGRVGIPK